jgi:hypothetical protein
MDCRRTSPEETKKKKKREKKKDRNVIFGEHFDF